MTKARKENGIGVDPLRILAVGWLLFAWSAESQARDLTVFLPPETVVAVQAPDAPSLIEQWTASPLAGLYDDPAAAGELAALRGWVGELEERLAGEHGLRLGEALGLVDGAFAIAGLPAEPGADDPLAWAVLLEHGGDPRVEALLSGGAIRRKGARLEKLADTAGRLPCTLLRSNRESAEPRPIRLGKPGALDALQPGKKPKSAARRVKVEEFHLYNGKIGEGRWVAVLAPAEGRPIDGILARLAAQQEGGSAPTLADRIAEDEMREEPVDLAGRDVEAFVNLRALAAWLEAHPDRVKSPVALNPRGLGLTDLQWLALRADLRQERLSFAGRLKIADEPRGIGRLLSGNPDRPPTKPLDAARFAPPETLFYSSTAWDVGALIDGLLGMLGEVCPEIQTMLDLQLQNAAMASGTDLRRDVIARLGGNAVHIVVGRPHAKEEGLPAVWMIEWKEPVAAGIALQSLLRYVSRAFGAFQLDRTELADGISLLSLREGRPSSAYVGRPFFHLGLGEDWLVLGVRRAEVQEVLTRMDGKVDSSLADLADFKTVREMLPERRFSEVFADPAGLLTVFLPSLFPQLVPATEQAPSQDARSSAIRKWVGPLGAARMLEEDGLSLRAFVVLR
jgi:hypothetical protein